MLVLFFIELIKFEKTWFKNYLFRSEGSNTSRETACSTCLFIVGFEVETMPKCLSQKQKKRKKLMKKIIQCSLTKKIIRKKILCTSTMAPARFFFDRWNTWSNMSQYPSKREKSCCLHEWNKKLKWNATQVFNFFFFEFLSMSMNFSSDHLDFSTKVVHSKSQCLIMDLDSHFKWSLEKFEERVSTAT
jgi:hypothetical protein